MDYRHHHAVQIVFVETPAAGSPQPQRQVKPREFKRDPPTPWRPATRPPAKQRQAAGALAFVRGVAEQELALQKMLRPSG
jgi:hypothetical protein